MEIHRVILLVPVIAGGNCWNVFVWDNGTVYLAMLGAVLLSKELSHILCELIVLLLICVDEKAVYIYVSLDHPYININCYLP